MTATEQAPAPELYPDQLALLEHIKSRKYMLAYGSSRGGKSWAFVNAIVARALAFQDSDHALIRRYITSIDKTIWKTLNDVIKSYGQAYYNECQFNQTTKTVRLHNGSHIYCLGAQDDQAVDKIMGAEFITMGFEEIVDFDFETYGKLLTRLNGNVTNANGDRLKPKLFATCNPTTKAHWVYQLFIRNVIPDTDLPIHNADDFGNMAFDQYSNPSVVDDYYDSLKSTSLNNQASKLEGIWRDDTEHSLFKMEHIKRCQPLPLESYSRIVVAVDPSVSTHGQNDECGIVVTAAYDDRYHVLLDASFSGSPDTIARKVISLYRDYQADCVVIEKNNGGHWIPTTISLTAGGANIPIKTVWASRGKRLRAEPIAALYEKHQVYHCDHFKTLETQMISFDAPHFKGSPDRLDALVWSLTHLSETRPAQPMRVQRIAGFMR